MGQSARSLEIVRTFSTPSMLGVMRELGLFRGKPPTREGARRLREALEHLGTTFVKFGQLISTRPDLIGEIYAEELTALQDAAHPVPVDEVRAVIERAL